MKYYLWNKGKCSKRLAEHNKFSFQQELKWVIEYFHRIGQTDCVDNRVFFLFEFCRIFGSCRMCRMMNPILALGSNRRLPILEPAKPQVDYLRTCPEESPIYSFTLACDDPLAAYWVLHLDFHYLISLWFTFLLKLSRSWTYWHWSASFSCPVRISMPAVVVHAVHLALLLALEISLLNFP